MLLKDDSLWDTNGLRLKKTSGFALTFAGRLEIESSGGYSHFSSVFGVNSVKDHYNFYGATTSIS